MEQLNVILFLVGFFRTVLVIVIIYYAIKILTKYVLPMFINQPKQHRDFRDPRNSKPEGEVTIERDRHKNGRVSKDEGEYVDFEEVD
ncbi:hypothetical protein [Sunxiuqinia dokdonensis]|uniref:DUF4834 domain-containing protein n=1 Tax=Sunxiuqinia dokdonensis TaxID=1409788 RepID=A0A0L8V7F1_9BACT|nr:hypothetical protein [Sunxiuqinia dokdonensis]KOH44127.1 hypothetical protein NC99_31200 [Sunxiuqinia dokdonensis]